jgi:hypothetical protein
LWFGDDLRAAQAWNHLCNFWVEQAMIEGVPMVSIAAVVMSFYTNPCEYMSCDYYSFSPFLTSAQSAPPAEVYAESQAVQ